MGSLQKDIGWQVMKRAYYIDRLKRWAYNLALVLFLAFDIYYIIYLIIDIFKHGGDY